MNETYQEVTLSPSPSLSLSLPLSLSLYIYIYFFNINHFSLIIFNYSVWLGFKLFGLRVQVYSQLVQFTLAHKAYDNHHCHNKHPDRKWAGV